MDPTRRFLDESSRWAAVALLSLLAHEDPAPPEWRLTLPKILCGLAPEDPWALDEPLALEAVEEAEHLLVAAISHAPILREMSAAELRASFLRRRGVITTRAGAWLLRVERAPYDLVLDRFPWSWTWVRLPWMPDPLQVEW